MSDPKDPASQAHAPAVAPEDKIPFAAKAAYGFGGVNDIFGHWLYPNLSSPVFTMYLGLAPNLVGTVLMIARLFDAFTDPLFGWISDNTRSRWGRRRPFLLIGFGRWGSSHPSLGIPVDWSQISGARAIVEATLPEMNVELSQGSHFFHNLSSFRASYFMVQHGRRFGINWNWLNRQPVVHESALIRHVRPTESLSVRVDGRAARGVILSPSPNNTSPEKK